MHRRLIHTTSALAATVALSACSLATGSPGSPDGAAGSSQPTADVAQLTDATVVSDAPGGTPLLTLPATTEFGNPTVVRVLAVEQGWLEVSLPVRPNESTGWIRADDVVLSESELAIEVDLSSFTLRVIDGDDASLVLLEAPVAIGADDTPTPAGEFYVTDVIDTVDDGGAYGTFAFGISAHSEVLTDFAGGDGQIGIHGTNEPASIGAAVSHGCIRVSNDVATALADLIEPGTPVVIG